jgi:hypothetical protein
MLSVSTTSLTGYDHRGNADSRCVIDAIVAPVGVPGEVGKLLQDERVQPARFHQLPGRRAPLV